MTHNYNNLNEIVNQMTTSEEGAQRLSFNELVNKVAIANNNNNSKKNENQTPSPSNNIVNSSVQNIQGYQPDNVYFGYQNIPDNPEYVRHVKKYLEDQLSIAMEYKEVELRIFQGMYRDMHPDHFRNTMNGYINNIIGRHRILLGNLYNYISNLPPDQQNLYQRTAVKYQLKLCAQLQYYKSSDKKKAYDKRIERLNKQIQDMQFSVDPNFETIMNGLIAEKNAVENESREFMNECIRNNGGFIEQSYYNQKYTPYNPLNNIVTFGGTSSPMDQTMQSMVQPKFVNPMTANTFKSATDDIYRQMQKNNPEDTGTYTPYYGESADNNYNTKYNYLNNMNQVNSGMNYLKHSNQNISSYKNKYIREMRRVGFVPESFGNPYVNDDYIMQLIWVTPVPDNNFYLDTTEPPTWYLTPQQLGFKDYAEANRDYLDSYRGVGPHAIKVIVPSLMSEEEREEYYTKLEIKKKNKKKKKKSSAIKVTIITKEEKIKKREEQEKKDAEELKKLQETSVEYMQPKFKDSDYVIELDNLNYVPKVVLDYLKTLKYEDVIDMCIDGLVYLNKYRQFIPFGISNQLDSIMQSKISSLEDELVEVKASEEKEKMIDEANQKANQIATELGFEEEIDDITDVDKLSKLRDLAREKVEQAINMDIPDFSQIEARQIIDECESQETGYVDNDQINIMEDLEEDAKLYEEYGLHGEEMLPYDPDDDDSIYAYLRKKKEMYDNLSYDDCQDIPLLSDGTTLEDAFNSIDINRIESDINKLKESIKKNINGDAFKALNNMERITYLRDVINGGLYDAIDMSKFRPGVHKFYTSKGVFVLDNRDFSVRSRMDATSLSPQMYNNYINTPKNYTSALDIYINKVILPTIKPEEKEIYKNETEYDYNQYINDLRILRKRDEQEMAVWKLNNAHPAYSMSKEATQFSIALGNLMQEYKDLTGMDPVNEDVTYAEWAERVTPFLRSLKNRGKNSKKAVEIYNIVSSYDYNNIGESRSHTLDDLSIPRFLPSEPSYSTQQNYEFSDINLDPEVFRERLKYTCNHVGDQKCYSTATSGVVDMTQKIPPIQYRGVKGGLFL